MKVLITGAAGVGKSSVIEVLKSRGYSALDADDICFWINNRTSKRDLNGERKKYTVSEKFKLFTWVPDKDRLNEFIVSNDPLFVAGLSTVVTDFHKLFNKLVLLTAPDKLIQKRLQLRSNNLFGSRSEIERKLVIDQLKPEIERYARGIGVTEVTTDRPLEQVVDEILTIIDL